MNNERLLTEINSMIEAHDIILWALQQDKYKNIIIDYKEEKQ